MKIITRREWGALPQAELSPLAGWPAGAALIVHHTAGPSAGRDALERQDAGLVRGIDRFHYYTRGWEGGVGYSYLVTEAGRVFEGRGLASGAHTVGRNHWPAVALVGDFSTRFPNVWMRQAVWELAEYVGARRLLGHRNFNATTCPGEGAMRGLVLVGPPAPAPAKLPPYGGSLRLVLNGRTWAGWAECADPLRWIARKGLSPDARVALAWRGYVWRGADDATNVARNLVRRFLS